MVYNRKFQPLGSYEGGFPNKGRYGCVSPGIRYFRGQFLTKKCVILDKRVKKVTYLMKISNFGALKFMKTCLVNRTLGTFLPGH